MPHEVLRTAAAEQRDKEQCALVHRPGGSQRAGAEPERWARPRIAPVGKVRPDAKVNEKEERMTPSGRLEGPRSLSRDRVSAYECRIDSSGRIIRGRYVNGWFGGFSAKKLQEELMPWLSQHATQRYSYPFLLTHHRLQEKTAVHIQERIGRKARVSDLSWSPRRPGTPKTQVAVVESAEEFRLLTP